ncbi:hypothetical protein [Ferrimonas balearica]|uniref:hypothetical protein n=1 Tax=Ferrimonas balearica TaxID=44012 RepID=UPI001C98FE65|nr:hypothetical protein [Ferrimonas balearica]MBY5992079.1 hypothetical protein [Ferrimonas balearica]
MLLKILLTLVVVLVGATLIKRRQSPVSAPRPSVVPPKAWILGLVVVAVLAGLWGYQRYQSQNQVLELTVFSASQGEPQRYLVRRGEMDGRRFVTLEGLQVQLSDQDRVEIKALDP